MATEYNYHANIDDDDDEDEEEEMRKRREDNYHANIDDDEEEEMRERQEDNYHANIDDDEEEEMRKRREDNYHANSDDDEEEEMRERQEDNYHANIDDDEWFFARLKETSLRIRTGCDELDSLLETFPLASIMEIAGDVGTRKFMVSNLRLELSVNLDFLAGYEYNRGSLTLRIRLHCGGVELQLVNQ